MMRSWFCQECVVTGALCGWLSQEHRTSQKYQWIHTVVLQCCFSAQSRLRFERMCAWCCGADFYSVVKVFIKSDNHDVKHAMEDSSILEISASIVAVRKKTCTEKVYFLDSCWRLSRLLLQQAAAGAAVVMVMSLWRQGTLFETMDCPSWCSAGEGSQLALPISAADGPETWPLSAEQHPFYRSPTPVSVSFIKPQLTAAQPGVSRGLESPATWMGVGSMLPPLLFKWPLFWMLYYINCGIQIFGW